MEKFLENWESFLNELEAAPKAAVKSLKKFKDDMLGGGAKSSAPFTKDGFPKDFNKPEEFSAPPGMEESQEIDEHIVQKDGKYCLMSKKSNKNLGCYDTKAGAEKRERQVQYFKHMKEGEVEEDKLFKSLSKSQRAHSAKLIRIKYKDRPIDIDGIIDPKVAKDELEEKKDRCYNIAKRKYKAFPSAYASGAIVKCRQGKIWKKEK
jgi:hypothetical protein